VHWLEDEGVFNKGVADRDIPRRFTPSQCKKVQSQGASIKASFVPRLRTNALSMELQGREKKRIRVDAFGKIALTPLMNHEALGRLKPPGFS